MNDKSPWKTDMSGMSGQKPHGLRKALVMLGMILLIVLAFAFVMIQFIKWAIEF